MITLHRDGFNYVEFLRRRQFIGPLYQSSADQGSHKFDGLLVPVEVALAEVQSWSGQETTRSDFVKRLKQTGVFVGDIEDFQTQRQKVKEQGHRRLETIEKLKRIADALDISYARIDHDKLSGRTGSIRDDGSISVDSRSKRHLSGIKRRLGFLEPSETGFKLDRTPTPREAEAIRMVLGIKKRPPSRTSKKSEAPTGEAAL